MESKRKKRLFNGIMVLLILVIAGCGVMITGTIRGWFGKKDPLLVTENVTGVASIQRSGIGYTLKKDTSLDAGDRLETKKGCTVKIQTDGKDSFVLNESSCVEIVECRQDRMVLKLESGTMFADFAGDHRKNQVNMGEDSLSSSNAVFSADVRTGSASVSNFGGEVLVTMADGTEKNVETGQCLSLSGEDSEIQMAAVSANSLSEFDIRQAQNCGSRGSLCFSVSDLQKVLDERASEKQAALEASLKSPQVIPKPAEEETDGQEQESADENAAAADPVENGESTGYGEDTAFESAGETQAQQEAVPETEGGFEDNSSSQEPVETAPNPTCTITIVCDTILNNMENLTKGKEAYVPADGCILAPSTVEFTEGETVLDVLQRVCDYAGIQLEYSWTPMYDSYYIEGMNNLYEFDCGNESGWMYKVNGWFPNYGCSSYTLADGDAIVWCYTCNGLGADVGGAVH